MPYYSGGDKSGDLHFPNEMYGTFPYNRGSQYDSVRRPSVSSMLTHPGNAAAPRWSALSLATLGGWTALNVNGGDSITAAQLATNNLRIGVLTAGTVTLPTPATPCEVFIFNASAGSVTVASAVGGFALEDNTTPATIVLGATRNFVRVLGATGAGNWFVTDIDQIMTTNGDMLVKSAGAFARLAASIPAANVRNVIGTDNGDTVPSYKTALDATAPTTSAIGDAAAAGTSLVFSHRDHTHGRETAATIGNAVFPAAAAYTPTITSDVGTPTSFTTQQGYWVQFGKLLFVSYQITPNNVGTATGRMLIQLPNSLSNAHNSFCSISGLDATTNLPLGTQVFTTNIYMTLAAGTTPFLTTHVYVLSGVIEVA